MPKLRGLMLMKKMTFLSVFTFFLLGAVAKKAFSFLCFHVNSGKMEKI